MTKEDKRTLTILLSWANNGVELISADWFPRPLRDKIATATIYEIKQIVEDEIQEIEINEHVMIPYTKEEQL